VLEGRCAGLMKVGGTNPSPLAPPSLNAQSKREVAYLHCVCQNFTASTTVGLVERFEDCLEADLVYRKRERRE